MSDGELVMVGVGVAYLVVALLVGLMFRHPHGSVHFERESIGEVWMLGMGWPMMALLLLYCWFDYRRQRRVQQGGAE